MASGISSVEVTVETPGENQVIEVTYDGQEVLQPPLTLAEHFAKQAGKIDFETVMDESSSPRYGSIVSPVCNNGWYALFKTQNVMS